MPETTFDPNRARTPDEESAPELDGQSTTVEEAMDAATDEEGFAHESAYSTPAGSTTIGAATSDDDQDSAAAVEGD